MRERDFLLNVKRAIWVGMLGASLAVSPVHAQDGSKAKLDVESAKEGTPLSELAEDSPEAKALREEINTNFEFLTAKVLSKARPLLESNGRFYPFAAAVGPNGKVNFAWTVSNEAENPNIDPAAALAALRQALAGNASKKRLLATATAYQYGRVDESGKLTGQQINIELEYITGDATVRAIPYEIKEDGSVTYQGMGEQKMEPRVFAQVVSELVEGEEGAQGSE
ncbi:hypothetical protein QPM17_00825 [Marinobacter sp. TBZ242]|uniref:Uncharacterized protein n=1 Tax=Marinobacter azerbaijanicus TaxID=3050455 RepID=A0ABT7I6J6_9GAMM|nr:hypothetical protein [Marinobacter sp. TBZ242]MDL0429655.1 hypothetical protein [Marinobacter sp. TBZ242]